MKKFNMQRAIRNKKYSRQPALLIIRGPRGILTSCGPDCYNSIHDECACICKGCNHRQGYEKSLQNSLNFIARLKKDNPEIQLSLHSKRKLAKLNQKQIIFKIHESKTYKFKRS